MVRKTFFRLNQTKERRSIWTEIVNKNPKIKILPSIVDRSLLKHKITNFYFQKLIKFQIYNIN